MALEKLKEGKKWNDVVTEFSEDKTRNGLSNFFSISCFVQLHRSRLCHSLPCRHFGQPMYNPDVDFTLRII